MLIPAKPANENQRLQELHALAVLDTKNEPLFDDLVKLSSHIMDCPISLISLVDMDRQWFKASVGLDAKETHRDISFCGHAIHEDKTFVVEDALRDQRFYDNPLVQNDPNIRFYAGHPLTTSEGFRVGTLCAIDRRTRTLSAQQLEMLECLARQASSLLERRRNELALEMTRRNSQTLFQRIPATIISTKGPQHILEYSSAPQGQLFGDGEATGRPLLDVHPEAREGGLLAVLDDVYQNGRTHSPRDATFLFTKERRHFDFVFTPSHGLDGAIDGVMGIIEDITQRKRLEQAVQKLHDEKTVRYEKMAELLERAPIGIALLSSQDHRFVFANRLYRQYFLKEAAFAGKRVQDVVASAHRDVLTSILKQVESTGESYVGQESSLVRTLASGAEEQISCNFIYEATRNDDGQISGIFAAVSDVTEQVQARVEISAQVDALQEERDIRERFVAALTHDLRTPLTAAKMSAELLLRRVHDPSQVQKIAERIIGCIDRGENMVRDLLDANLLKAGQPLPILVSKCNLGDILQDALSDFRVLRGREFSVQGPVNEVNVYWDRGAIRRVIENLTNNAVKYGAKNTEITFATQQRPHTIEISVHNEGPPIPSEEQATLFDTYRRADAAIGTGQKGWGIGLTLVRGIAEAHGGSVRVESQTGKGTTFFVNLPLDCRSGE